jgi:hypothetical protein
LYAYQRKGFSKKAVCKLLKIKGRFAQRVRSGTLCRSGGADQSIHTPHPPGHSCIDIKQKGLQIGMLEVVENKGTNWRLKGALMRLIETEERSWRGLVITNTT